jgi:hypothetical protein
MNQSNLIALEDFFSPGAATISAAKTKPAGFGPPVCILVIRSRYPMRPEACASSVYTRPVSEVR